jgi:hypothetical protein
MMIESVFRIQSSAQAQHIVLAWRVAELQILHVMVSSMEGACPPLQWGCFTAEAARPAMLISRALA